MKNKACKNCPYSKESLRGFLADYSVSDLHMVAMSEQHFPCHMELPNNSKLTYTLEEAKTFPRCIGSLLYMKKGCKMPLNPILKSQLDDFTKEELDQVLSIPEFFKHHNIEID